MRYGSYTKRVFVKKDAQQGAARTTFFPNANSSWLRLEILPPARVPNSFPWLKVQKKLVNKERIPEFRLNGPRFVLFRERGIRGPVRQLSTTTLRRKTQRRSEGYQAGVSGSSLGLSEIDYCSTSTAQQPVRNNLKAELRMVYGSSLFFHPKRVPRPSFRPKCSEK